MTGPKKVARTIGELLLIVAGVLIALAADSAWNARNERAREQLYLEQLLADTRRNGEELAAAIEEESGYSDAAREGMRFVQGDEGVGPEVLRGAMNLRRSAFVPTTATLRALVLYGDVGIVRDPRVRAAVVGTSDVFETYMNDLRVLDASSLDILRDLLELSWRHSRSERLAADPQTGPALQMAEIYNRNRAGLLMRMRDANAELQRLLEER